MSDPSSVKFRILELFAGIGGLHWALKVASLPCEVVSAMEINPTVISVYKHNFPSANVITKNLLGLTAQEINDLKIDAIVMSPPCQPFCRTGNRLDVEDNRTGPLSHITNILQEVSFQYIFVENVQGFEDSTARENLLEALEKLNFRWQEFMLTPRVVGVPNSRLRYYLIGKHKDLNWTFKISEGNLLTTIPSWDNPDDMPFEKLKELHERELYSRRKLWKSAEAEISDCITSCVGDVIEWDLSEDAEKKLKLKDSTLSKYYQAMDIVTPMSVSTCCFTKGYGHFVKGTGSVLNQNCDKSKDKIRGTTDEDDVMRSLRYFSPKEISRLMSYPEEFTFPENLSLGQKYKSLGNSVNVYVVAILFTLLFSS